MSLATCLCASYLTCVNLIMLILGIFGMVLMLFVLISGSSLTSFDEFSQLAATRQAMWGTVIGGILITIASCFGLRFAQTKERCNGCCYLSLVLLAMLLQTLMVIVVLGGDVAQVKALQGGLVSEETAQDYQTKRSDQLKNTMSKALLAWLDTFNNPEEPDKSKRCTFKNPVEPPDLSGLPGWLNPFSTSLTEDGGDLDADSDADVDVDVDSGANSALASATDIDAPGLSGWAASVDRRLANPFSDIMMYPVANTFCVPKKREVNCERDETRGNIITNNCMAAVDTDAGKAEFKENCAGCYLRFWEAVEAEKQFPDSTTGKANSLRYRTLFLRGGGQSFCRCLSGVLGMVKAHFPKIVAIAVAFLIFEVVVLLSTIWLMVIGPEKEKRAISRSSFSGDVELAQRRRSSSGLIVETVECPEGCKPGDPIMVTTQAGQNVQVIVPDGVWPGMMFNVEIPV